MRYFGEQVTLFAIKISKGIVWTFCVVWCKWLSWLVTNIGGVIKLQCLYNLLETIGCKIPFGLSIFFKWKG